MRYKDLTFQHTNETMFSSPHKQLLLSTSHFLRRRHAHATELQILVAKSNQSKPLLLYFSLLFVNFKKLDSQIFTSWTGHFLVLHNVRKTQAT